jgi:N6-adenosine-specific RNA methylase IME4
MTYEVIVADPPWSFSDNLVKMKKPVRRSSQSQYQTLPVGEIVGLDVPSLVNPTGCLLALWVPSSLLKSGLDVMRWWGFDFKQTFIWVKLKKDFALEEDWNQGTRVGMGRLFRQSHEIALIGTSGKSVYPLLEDHSQRSVAFDFNQGHSIKPPTLQERLETMFPTANKLEMFARRSRPGWTCIGDAVTGKDIKASIQELKVV